MSDRQSHAATHRGHPYKVTIECDSEGKYHFARWQLEGLPARAVVGDRPYPQAADAVAMARTFVEHRIDLIIEGNQAADQRYETDA